MQELSSEPPRGGTFVSVGNRTEPFHRLLDAVRIGVEAGCLPAPVTVQSGHTPFEHGAMSVVPFVDMDAFQGYVRRASLLVLHGGAGSLITALRAGAVPVVMARRHPSGEVLDDHQLELVRGLADLRRIVVIDTPQDICRAVEDVRALQREAAHEGSGPSSLAEHVRQDLAHVARSLRVGPRQGPSSP